VLAVVGCRTEQANKEAEIVLSNGLTEVRSAAGEAKPLCQVVTAGEWDIEVRFPSGRFQNTRLPPQRLLPLVFEGVDVP
jgi:hypothetical protein